jgi:hypothetical protein
MRLQAPRGAHAAKLAGDVDGDGRGDVVVAHGGTADGRAAASVVWGSPSREPLVVGTNTMRSTLISALGPLLDVHPVGDVNGDGLADLLVASWAGEGAS